MPKLLGQRHSGVWGVGFRIYTLAPTIDVFEVRFSGPQAPAGSTMQVARSFGRTDKTQVVAWFAKSGDMGKFNLLGLDIAVILARQD